MREEEELVTLLNWGFGVLGFWGFGVLVERVIRLMR
jgi:hypothetical protein